MPFLPSRTARPAPTRNAGAFLALLHLCGCAGLAPGGDPTPTTDPAPPPPRPPGPGAFEAFRAYGRLEAREIWNAARSAGAPGYADYGSLHALAEHRAQQAGEVFFKGQYNKSRARLPQNIERWRSEANIANPGPDLANFPNSAFTLPRGRAYIELSPFAYYGPAQASPPQYNAEFLLRYGATDDIELRVFGNGVSWTGGSQPAWGFSPIAFDTKIQLWTENPAYFLPAAGFEAYIQTQWLGSAAFDEGTQPAFTFNFDQSLPFDIDLEYNLGATRLRDPQGQNRWELSFQWGLQRDLFDQDFAVFVHGFYNAMTLPRLPNVQIAPDTVGGEFTQTAIGAGFLWTVNRRLSVYGQASGGATRFTPSIIGMTGFAVAF